MSSLLSGIKYDEPFGSLLVHDSVSALPAADGVPWTNFVFVMTFATNVDHRLLGSPGPTSHVHTFVHDNQLNLL